MYFIWIYIKKVIVIIMLNWFYIFVVVLLLFDAFKVAASGPSKIPILGLIPNGLSRPHRAVMIVNKEDDWVDSCK